MVSFWSALRRSGWVGYKEQGNSGSVGAAIIGFVVSEKGWRLLIKM